MLEAFGEKGREPGLFVNVLIQNIRFPRQTLHPSSPKTPFKNAYRRRYVLRASLHLACTVLHTSLVAMVSACVVNDLPARVAFHLYTRERLIISATAILCLLCDIDECCDICA